MKNKKAIGTMGVIMALIILVVVLGFWLNWWTRIFGAEKANAAGFITDFDGDGVVNNVDKCKCGSPGDSSEYGGCPAEYDTWSTPRKKCELWVGCEDLTPDYVDRVDSCDSL